MTGDQIQDLFRKYYDKTASDKERQQLFYWISQQNNREKAEELLLLHYNQEFEVADNSLPEIDPDALLQYILATQPAPEHTSGKIRWIKPLSIAASILIAFGIYFFYQSQTKQPLITDTTTYDIPAGGNKAILTLSDGNKVILDSLSDGAAIEEGNIRITKSDDGQVTYSVRSAATSRNTFNTIETPVGGFYQIQLPDGTRVWLNALSSLKFPTSFTAGSRKVQLKGEAYFEVAKDKSKPFIVDVNDMQVTVLGTHFNINSYTPQSAIYTTVLEGSVAVSKSDLKKTVLPGQQLQYNGDNMMQLESNVDLDQIMAWKDGYFTKKSISLNALMAEVARWYGVNIVYSEPIQAEFVMKLPKDISLKELITVLELTEEVKFDLNTKTLKVMKTKK
ncbi:FecR family protein [Sphingobacterium spiritivorum]|uniref:FecR family protein n=1 Tax=Sphingobacterium spiritivorum TaxID=258 RepID=UPI003DA43C07